MGKQGESAAAVAARADAAAAAAAAAPAESESGTAGAEDGQPGAKMSDVQTSSESQSLAATKDMLAVVLPVDPQSWAMRFSDQVVRRRPDQIEFPVRWEMRALSADLS